MAEETKDIFQEDQSTQQVGETADNKVGNRVDKRIQDVLSQKSAAEQRAEIAEKKARDAEFALSFNEMSAKYPKASEFKDKVKELVDKGYDVQDATVSILAKNNALQTQEQATQEHKETQGFGGSADINISGSGKKSLEEMSKEELLAELIEAEKNGDLRLS